MIIYKITNTINGKVYIGQTIHSLEKRWVAHCRKGSECTSIRNSIQKYGKENFKIEVIEQVETLEDLNLKEEFWIDYYESTDRSKGYNLTTGGSNAIPTEETRKRISEAGKGRTMSEENKRLLQEAKRRIGTTQEIRENITKAQRARRLRELETNDLKFIAKERKRFRVVVFGKYVGSSNFLDKAKEIRDNYIKELLDKEKNSEL